MRKSITEPFFCLRASCAFSRSYAHSFNHPIFVPETTRYQGRSVRSCGNPSGRGNCSKSVKKVLTQLTPLGWLDTILECPTCGWVGVESKYVGDQKQKPIQLDFFAPQGGVGKIANSAPQDSPETKL